MGWQPGDPPPRTPEAWRAFRDCVAALVSEGLSCRQAARRLGVSRALVSRAVRDEPPRSAERFTRCGGCGGLVIEPCRACRIERLRRAAAACEPTRTQ